MARIGADGASPATESDGDSTTDDTETARTETRATRASEGDPFDDATAGRDVYDPGSDDPTGEETGGDTTRTYPADDPEPETQEPSDSRSSRPDAGADDAADSSSVDETQGIRDRVREAGQRARDAATGAVGAARRVADRYEPPAGTGGDPFEGAQAGSDVIRNGRPGINPRRQAAEEAAEERREAAINAQRGAAEAVEQETGKNPFLQEAQDRQADAINAQRGAAEAVASETGANPLVAEQEESVARQITEETGLEAGEDFTVETRGESLDVELTESGREEVQGGEQFGDWEVRVPFTAGEDGKNKRLEDMLGSASESYTRGAESVASDVFDDDGVASESLIAEGLEAAGQDEAATRFEEGLRSFGKGTVKGAAAIGNVPGLALGLKEGGEFVGWSADQGRIEVEKQLGLESEASSKRDVDALGQTGAAAMGAGAALEESFNENPAGFGGAAVGSLAASAGIMGGAAKISPTAGKATRFAIQPGEELASVGATKVFRGVSKASLKTDRGPDIPDYTQRLPGGKIDNEELAIFAGRKAASKTRDVAGRVSSSYQRLGQSQRVGAGLVPPKMETELEMEGSNNRYSPDEDLLDDALTQYQDSLGASARTELDAEREQLSDVGQEVADTDTASVENQLTFEPEDVTRPTRRPDWETARPYRGRQQTRADLESESVGQTWGWESELESEVKSENSVELATEGDLGSGFRTEFFGPETDGDVPLELDVERETLFESEGTVERDGVFESEFETELTGEQTFDLDQEVELDQEQEFEFGQEQEFALENELAYEQETELETELAFEAESGQELEFESEGRKKQSGGAFVLDVETDDDLFSSGIADVTKDDFRNLGL